MASRPWELSSDPVHVTQSQKLQMVRDSLASEQRESYDADAQTRSVSADLLLTETRHRGIVKICSDPNMIKKCCTSNLDLQRLPQIKALCDTRASHRY